MASHRHIRARRSATPWAARALGWLVLVSAAAFALLTIVIPVIIGATPYTVLSGSMRPAYPPGAMVAVRPIDSADVTVGAVVTYQIASGEPAVVTHRVVAIEAQASGERTLVTQGDANPEPDPDPVRIAQLRGVVVYGVPLLGYVLSAVSGDNRQELAASAAGLFFGWGALQLALGIHARRRTADDALPSADLDDRHTAASQ